MVINFFLSPFIVKNIGVEANGFVQLANNFVSYATLLVSVINSMAGRFVTIELHKGNIKKANIYYTSVFFANIVLLVIFAIPSVFIILNLDKIIQIPKHIVLDVKLLFSFVFLNFLSGLAVPMWGTATYITNKLYISSLGSIVSSIIRVTTILILFTFFKAKVWFIGFSAFLVMVFVKIWNYYHKSVLIPEIKIAKKSFNCKTIVELMASGIWNAISQLGIMLLTGLDLLICNMFVGSFEMGILALANAIPRIIQNLSSAITNVFAPELTINYAKGNKEGIKKDLEQAMAITGTILTIPLSILFVFGDAFFVLWIPTENHNHLWLLSSLVVAKYIFTSGIQALYNVFVTVNKVKTDAISLLISGTVNTVVVFICLKTTTLGVFAIAGVSSIILVIRNILFTVPVAAKYLDMKITSFFPQVGKSVISVLVIIAIGFVFKWIYYPHTWFALASMCALTGLVGFAINIFIVLNQKERIILKNLLKSKLRRR